MSSSPPGGGGGPSTSPQQAAKRVKPTLPSGSASASGSANAYPAAGPASSSSSSHTLPAGPLYLPPPPVPSPAADSATMRTIHAKLSQMWEEQTKETSALKIENKKEFKTMNDLPLARIKRVMKSDEDVRMISAEAPILFAKACECFVLDLTIRCWAYSEHNNRQGLEREDVLQVLKETRTFDFLAAVLIQDAAPPGSLVTSSGPPSTGGAAGAASSNGSGLGLR